MAGRRKAANRPATLEGAAPRRFIPDEHVDFLVPGVSVLVASRDARMVPSLSRGVACRVSADRRSLTVLLRRSRAETLLDDIATCGRVASCHSLPRTHRTIQLKGRDACIEAALPDDLALAAAFAKGFCEQLLPFGYTESYVRAMLHTTAEDLVAVRFTPTEIYSQTPGPEAGRRVA